MKKISLICATVLLCGSLAACGSKSSQSSASTSSSSKTSKHVKTTKHSQAHKDHKNEQDSNISRHQNSSENVSTQNSNNQSVSNQQSGPANSTKSQSEINRERGYDPTGAPLLPGQDHAAGANPDGTPDAWVQGQIDWAIQNGYMNPDGTNTPKGQAAEDEVARDSQPGMP